jgi:molecular chaperone DnaJ
MAKDYYEVLGVPKDASPDQIKRAYRDLAMRYHPDKNKNHDAEEKFKEINEAYAVLSNDEKRRQYDTFGPEQFGRRFSEEDIFRGFDFENMFRDIGFNFADFGGNPFGGTQFGNTQQRFMFDLSTDDIEHGSRKELNVRYLKRCENCKGSGGEPGSKLVRCTKCDGRGQINTVNDMFFIRMQSVATCDRCMGRGKMYEKRCKDCGGRGTVQVSKRVRIDVHPVD